jgi:hypothetical protein
MAMNQVYQCKIVQAWCVCTRQSRGIKITAYDVPIQEIKTKQFWSRTTNIKKQPHAPNIGNKTYIKPKPKPKLVTTLKIHHPLTHYSLEFQFATNTPLRTRSPTFVNGGPRKSPATAIVNSTLVTP